MLWSLCAMGQNDCDGAFANNDYQQALSLCETELSSATEQRQAQVLMKLIDISHELDLKSQHQDYLSQLRDLPAFNKNPEYRYFWYRKMAIKAFFERDIDQAQQYFHEALAFLQARDCQSARLCSSRRQRYRTLL